MSASKLTPLGSKVKRLLLEALRFLLGLAVLAARAAGGAA